MILSRLPIPCSCFPKMIPGNVRIRSGLKSNSPVERGRTIDRTADLDRARYA